MIQPDVEHLKNFLVTRGVDFLVQVLAAIALYIVGRWVIWGIRSGVRKALEHRQFDPTLSRYLDQTIAVILTLVLALAALGVLGVQTTSLAGLLAAAGVAIGVAWSGLLANFAAGVILVALRPFKKGDSVQIGGVQGEVELIGLFGTTLLSGDGARVVVGNSRIFGDNIHNFSTGPHRRVEARVQLPWAADPSDFHKSIRARLAEDPRVFQSPPPLAEILEHNALGPVSVIRAWSTAAHHGEVAFLVQRLIAEGIAREGFVPPSPTGSKAPAK